MTNLEKYNAYKDWVKTKGIKGVCKTCLHKKGNHFDCKDNKYFRTSCRIITCKCKQYRKSKRVIATK